MIKERAVRSVPGIPAFLFLLTLVIVVAGVLVWYAGSVIGGSGSVGLLEILGLVVIIGILVALLISMNGLTIVHPNEARALILFWNPVREEDRRARHGPQGPDGQQPAGRPLQRARGAADRQRRDALLVG